MSTTNATLTHRAASHVAAWCGVGTRSRPKSIGSSKLRASHKRTQPKQCWLPSQPHFIRYKHKHHFMPTVTLQANEPEVLNCMLFGWSPPLRLASKVRKKIDSSLALFSAHFGLARALQLYRVGAFRPCVRSLPSSSWLPPPFWLLTLFAHCCSYLHTLIKLKPPLIRSEYLV